MIAIAAVLGGFAVFGCASRPFEEDELGGTDDEAGSSESESSTGTTFSTSESEDQVDESPDDLSTSDTVTDWEESTDTTESTSEESTDEFTSDGETQPDGATCTQDSECASNNCYVVPFLGGQCGECNEDADCVGGGCSPPNPFEANGSFCNMGELGGGCESSDVCMPGLVCGNVLDLLGLIQIDSCGNCTSDVNCQNGQICAPLVDLQGWAGYNDCIAPGSVPQDGYCLLEGNGDQACASGVCSVVDIMGLAMIGACGQCNNDADCVNGSCVPGEFILDSATLTGSTCQ